MQILLSSENWITVVAPHRLAHALPVRDNRRYKLAIRFHGLIRARFKKGTEALQLVAKFRDGTEQIVPCVAAQSASKAAFWPCALNGLKSLVSA